MLHPTPLDYHAFSLALLRHGIPADPLVDVGELLGPALARRRSHCCSSPPRWAAVPALLVARCSVADTFRFIAA